MSVITSTPGQLQVIKRTGDVAAFDAEKFLSQLVKHFWRLKANKALTRAEFMIVSSN